MIVKHRIKPNELVILEALQSRGSLSSDERQKYYSMKKGYEGEVQFDRMTEKLHSDCLILNDLLFEVNHTTFQIDSLILTHRNMLLYEIKNFEGDYYYESEKMYKTPNFEITNPLHQLSRSETLFRQLLQNQRIQPTFESFLLFINPAFTLYHAPLNQPIILPTQIERHLHTLDSNQQKLTSKHTDLANRLIAASKENSPYEKVPSYAYEQLRKGVNCLRCQSLSVDTRNKNCLCLKCGKIEPAKAAVLRMAKEFRILFPEKKMTSGIIYEWCGRIVSQKTIRRILAANFKIIGERKWTHYQ